MKNRTPRSFRLWHLGILYLILVLGVIVCLAPGKYNEVLSRLLGSSHAENPPLGPRAESKQQAGLVKRHRSPRRDPDEWFAEIIARHPELEPKWRNVPDHENGFLQWLDFCEERRTSNELGSESLGIPEEIREMIANDKDWDSEVIKAYLAENRELLDEISRIGLLPGQSAAGIAQDRFHFTPARFNKECVELLLADARLAAESGDLQHALKQVKAAGGLSNHLDQIEAPSLLMNTVSVLLRMRTQEQVMEHLLPNLGTSPETIASWREITRVPLMDPSTFSHVLRSESWYGVKMMISALNGDYAGFTGPEIPDPDALLDAFATGAIHSSEQLQNFSYDQLMSGKNLYPGHADTDHLSSASRELLDKMSIGMTAWTKNRMRCLVISSRFDAAMAIMQGEEAPVEPITGLPYVYDAESRTLHVPDDPRLRELLNIEKPLELP